MNITLIVPVYNEQDTLERFYDAVRNESTLPRFYYRLYNRIAWTHIEENVGDFRLLDQKVVAAIRQLVFRNAKAKLAGQAAVAK